MDPEFWLKRWREGATGFHMTRVTPLLAKYWHTLGLAPSTRVLVPLCGKSLDMAWLASQGHSVLGIELAPIAVEEFFAEQALRPTQHTTSQGMHYVAGQIEILCGDIFDVEPATLATCAAAYDRAALVALPPEMRARYVQHVYGSLAPEYRGMLLTLEYEQSRMEGPPFSVPRDEVLDLFAGHGKATEQDRLNIIDKEPKFAARGLESLDSVTWRLDDDRRVAP
jgi:thiopurine S-methyltransferase